LQKEIRSPIEQSQDYRLCFAEAFPRTAKTRLIFAWQPSLARSNRPMQTPKKAAVPKNAPCNPTPHWPHLIGKDPLPRTELTKKLWE
jgi:hypothetical protein